MDRWERLKGSVERAYQNSLLQGLGDDPGCAHALTAGLKIVLDEIRKIELADPLDAEQHNHELDGSLMPDCPGCDQGRCPGCGLPEGLHCDPGCLLDRCRVCSAQEHRTTYYAFLATERYGTLDWQGSARSPAEAASQAAEQNGMAGLWTVVAGEPVQVELVERKEYMIKNGQPEKRREYPGHEGR